MRALKFASVMAGCLMMTGCTGSGGGGNNSAAGTPAPFDINMYAVNNTVCNPMGSGGSNTEPTQGLQANLYYLDASQPRYTDVADMINNGHQSDKNLFFSQLYIPTRLFTEGFPLQSGGMIQDDSGNDLLEYFALRFTGVLHLGPNEAEGDYQLGLLADDGAIWSVSSSETGTDYSVVVNDDGTHPTQMGCGPIVHMTQGTSLAMKIDYYQGPRYEIALVPIWRLVNSSTPSDPLCGQNGNYLFFDPDNQSVPEPAFNQLLTRGWYPLGVQNFSVTAASSYNPCTTGTVPVISGISFANGFETGPFYTVTWTTDIPATDQVLYTDTGTGIQSLTVSSNMLNTSHSVQITVEPGHTYSVQVVSVSADLGKAISNAITLVVP